MPAFPPPPPPPARSPKLPRPASRMSVDRKLEIRILSNPAPPRGPRVRSMSPCVQRKRLSATTIVLETKMVAVSKPPQRSSSPKPARERAKRRGSVQPTRGRSSSVQPTRGRSCSPKAGRFTRQGSRTSVKEARPTSPKLERPKRAASTDRRQSIARSCSPKPARARAVQKRHSSLLKNPTKNGSIAGKTGSNKEDPGIKTKKKKVGKKTTSDSPKMSVMKKLAAAHAENSGKKSLTKPAVSPKLVAMKKPLNSEVPNKLTANRRFRDLPKGSMSRAKDNEILRGSMSRPKSTEIPRGSMSRPKSLDMPRGSLSRPKDSGLPKGSISAPKDNALPKESLSSASTCSEDSGFEIAKDTDSAYSDTVSVTSEDDASSYIGSNVTSEESWDGVSRNVSFGTVDVQEFRYSMGTDVVTSIGPPVTLCRKPVRSLIVDLESYEQERAPVRRDVRDLRLSEDDRINILQKHGYSVEEIELASWESETVRNRRFKSIKNKEWDGWAAASESFSRKLGKMTSPQALFGF